MRRARTHVYLHEVFGIVGRVRETVPAQPAHQARDLPRDTSWPVRVKRITVKRLWRSRSVTNTVTSYPSRVRIPKTVIQLSGSMCHRSSKDAVLDTLMCRIRERPPPVCSAGSVGSGVAAACTIVVGLAYPLTRVWTWNLGDSHCAPLYCHEHNPIKLH